MNDDEYKVIIDLIDQALDLGVEARELFLKQACKGNPALFEKVAQCLAFNPEMEDFLETSPMVRLEREQTRWKMDLLDDLRALDGLELGKPLGEGGMGQVYLAIETTTQRNVALKIVRPDYDMGVYGEWFRVEYRLLARMSHQNIARILQVGFTPNLRAPYFVMEHVSGESLGKYLSSDPPLSIRLNLFEQICRGVAHAHQKQVIHRDLKPSNILITELDGEPTAKIIDFGIAKGLFDDESEAEKDKDQGVMVGTPVFSSPEQFQADQDEIDQQTDVYGLGAVLYVLLTGAPPYEQAVLNDMPVRKRTRFLCETNPPKPSKRHRDMGGRDVLPAELDCITMKAMSKEKSNRYAAVPLLIDDIRRFRNGEVVSAHPDTLTYRLGKLVRRYRYQSYAVGIVLLLAVGAFTTIVNSNFKTRRAEENAVAVGHVLEQILISPRPSEAGMNLRVLDLIARAREIIQAGKIKDPLVRADLYRILGQTNYQLGDYGSACAFFEDALTIRQRAAPPETVATLDAKIRLGNALRDSGSLPQSRQLFAEVLEAAERKEYTDLEIQALNGYAECLRLEGWTYPAMVLFQDAVDRLWRLGEEKEYSALVATRHLGALYGEIGEKDVGVALLWDIYLIQRDLYGEGDAHTILTWNEWANFHLFESDLNEIADTLVDNQTQLERMLGQDHPYTLAGLYLWCRVSFLQGDYALIEAPLETLIAARSTIHGSNHRMTTNAKILYALTLKHNGRIADAVSQLELIFQWQQERLGLDSHAVLETAINLGDSYFEMGEYDKAAKLLARILFDEQGLWKKTMPALVGRCTLGESYISMGRLLDARTLFQELIKDSAQFLGREHHYYWFFNACYGYSLSLMDIEHGRQVIEESYQKLKGVPGLSQRISTMMNDLDKLKK